MGLHITPIRALKITQEEETLLKEIHQEIFEEKRKLETIGEILDKLDSLVVQSRGLIERSKEIISIFQRLCSQHVALLEQKQQIPQQFKTEFHQTLLTFNDANQQLVRIGNILGRFETSLAKLGSSERNVLNKLSYEVGEVLSYVQKNSVLLYGLRDVINSDFASTMVIQ
jgi:hypothetical protein